ncbi:MarR family winged helix-turn-helix transcriptional regulator [Jeotgalibacillus salarius]|uniref:MarR family transcriptional regulator n=1 Tax=Jeotgalibacillus salarius TaxID=546023 RepID=A0A4Y8LCC4_9BACL|nr:MarR family transcriptional regulator [Jeotgalibacillus salarius]TFD99724.1 MarR family transcriptional regulator [Jeotgalibacillus salarius]
MQTPNTAGRWLSTVHRYSYIFLSKTFAEYGIGQGQIKFLLMLFEHDGLTQEHMAGELNIDKATVARAIRKLETAGYVDRIPHESDRRSNLIYLTEKAKGIESVIKKEMNHWTEILTEGFSEKEKQTAIDLLKRMAGNAVKEVEGLEEVKTNEAAK